MHYRHAFHAGNFADVFKHALLCALLEALNRKDKPWCYHETHAGAGAYDLRGEGAQRTGEWREGIARLYGIGEVPESLAAYLRIVRALQLDAGNGSPGDADAAALPAPQCYPGSPLFARAFARPGDRLVLCERVPVVADELRAALRGPGVSAAVHLRDGYELPALLPPKERRGLVLIDPPFERADEFEAVADLAAACLARFGGGIVAAWYPLKNSHAADRCLRRVARETARPLLDLRLETGAPSQGQMHACGLLVVNPPFGFEAQARTLLDFLAPRLAQGPKARGTVADVAH